MSERDGPNGRRYLAYWAGVALAFGVCGFAWWWLAPKLIVKTDTTTHWARVQRNKSSLAASTPSPKLLLVGASGTLYGMRADVINRELRVPVVNLGLQASFGLRYVLERSKMDIQRGDVVLLTVEYGLLRGHPNYTANAIEFLYAGDDTYLNRRPFVERLLMPFRMSPSRLVTESLKARRGNQAVERKSLRLLDSFGDGLFGNAGPTREMAAIIRKRDTYDGAGPDAEGIAVIREYAEWCRKHGVRLLLTYPAYARLADVETDGGRTFMKRLAAEYAKIGVPVLGEPSDFFYPPDWFFDTRYHPRKAFADQSTMQRLPALRPYLVELMKPTAEEAQPRK